MNFKRFQVIVAALFVLSLVSSACGSSGSGAPSTPGEYSVQKDSVHFDGERYQLYWADNAQNGALHHMDTRNLRLVRDPSSTFLEVPQSGDPILHLSEDEPITVDGQDRQGTFGSPWFPFLLGASLGNGVVTRVTSTWSLILLVPCVVPSLDQRPVAAAE